MDFNEVKSVAIGGYSKVDIENYVKYHNEKYSSLLENSNSQIAFYASNVNELEKAVQLLNLQNKDLQDEINKLRMTIEMEYRKITNLDKEIKWYKDGRGVGESRNDPYDAQKRANFIISKAHDESGRILTEVKHKASIVLRKLKNSEDQATNRANVIADALVEQAKQQAFDILEQAKNDSKAIMTSIDESLTNLAGVTTSVNPNLKLDPVSSESTTENATAKTNKPYAFLQDNQDMTNEDEQLSISIEDQEEQLSLHIDSIKKELTHSLEELEETLGEL